MVPLVLALTTSIGRPNTVQDFPIENEAREIPSMGPFAINLTVVTIGGFVTPTKTQTAYVYYPVSGPTHGPFPFVVYMHGMAMDIEPDQMKTLYEGEWEAIASHGFVVAAPRSGDGVSYYQDFYKDQLRTIEVARELGASLSPALANADFSHVGVAGHSMGGDATCRSAAAPGYNISAAVALHPSMWPTMNRGAFGPTNIEVPTFFGTGNLDVVVPAEIVKKAYDEDPHAGKVLAEIDGIGHMEPTNKGDKWRAYAAQFFLCHLKTNATACGYIYGSGPQSLCHFTKMTDCKVTPAR